VGRTARAGRAGEGITLVTPEKLADVRAIAHRLDLHAEFTSAGFPAPPRTSARRRDAGARQSRSVRSRGGRNHRRSA
jgi:superfamily II DNA/RNA helicase